MKISKAVITAAGRTQRAIPLQSLVDRDGVTKSALRILINEAVSAGIAEICVVIAPGDKEAYERAAGDEAGRLKFIEQTLPRGYGHALFLAKSFVGNEPFLHMVSDHLWISGTEQTCAQQLVDVALREDCSVSAVQSTREHLLPYFGAIGGRRIGQSHGLYEVETVMEKPTPTQAEQTLMVPGLRAGHYLCLFGMHVLTPVIMDLLSEQLAAAPAAEAVPISGALALLADKQRYLAVQVEGLRYDMGGKYGLLFAQLAMALDGSERAEILEQIVELLVTRERGVQS
jgi:UTP--glucose-1-phosphate uridylyltransferase